MACILTKKTSFFDLSKEKVSGLIDEHYGNLYKISNILKISRKLLVHYIESDEDLKNDLIQSKYSIKDLAEANVIKHIKEGNLIAAIKTLERLTGYTDKNIKKIIEGEEIHENNFLNDLTKELEQKDL